MRWRTRGRWPLLLRTRLHRRLSLVYQGPRLRNAGAGRAAGDLLPHRVFEFFDGR
jgi:hypothetical protein